MIHGMVAVDLWSVGLHKKCLAFRILVVRRFAPKGCLAFLSLPQIPNPQIGRRKDVTIIGTDQQSNTVMVIDSGAAAASGVNESDKGFPRRPPLRWKNKKTKKCGVLENAIADLCGKSIWQAKYHRRY
ncbi:hypothetical protein PoB_006165100 [Plakobranchus ocellatus]|uniref:Uncharacterized protein n=1 Tax=Plakobranchus ocellatus TaxID=259542 RepID=A0AAV4CTV7_9GAST|nr:hypothetical protein PoB_006165100 [Plakobranchus ocellatus]